MADWRSDPRWTLVYFSAEAFRDPPTRPTAIAERSFDGKWAHAHDENDAEIASWVLTGLDAKERRDLAERAKRRRPT